MSAKIPWQGRIISVQPRIRLSRSFDERHHSYLGYALVVEGRIDERDDTFSLGIGKAAESKHQFRRGDVVCGASREVADPRMETVSLYKTSGLEVLARGGPDPHSPPPWHGVPPELEVYRERGHRRLNRRTYGSKCTNCIWGCLMAVEMIIDQWNPEQKRYQVESFCYGPKSCKLYKAGPTRKVPGRGMTFEEEEWVDEQETAHRAPDE